MDTNDDILHSLNCPRSEIAQVFSVFMHKALILSLSLFSGKLVP